MGCGFGGLFLGDVTVENMSLKNLEAFCHQLWHEYCEAIRGGWQLKAANIYDTARKLEAMIKEKRAKRRIRQNMADRGWTIEGRPGFYPRSIESSVRFRRSSLVAPVIRGLFAEHPPKRIRKLIGGRNYHDWDPVGYARRTSRWDRQRALEAARKPEIQEQLTEIHEFRRDLESSCPPLQGNATPVYASLDEEGEIVFV